MNWIAFAMPIHQARTGRVGPLAAGLHATWSERIRAAARRLRRDGGEQPVELASQRVVALAGAGLEAGAVGDLDAPALIADEPRALQLARGHGDARPAHAEHLREKLLRQVEFARADAVVGREEPPAHALLHAVHVIARRGLRHLVEHGLRVAANDVGEFGMLVERTPEAVGAHPERLPGHLADRLQRSAV